MKTMYVRMENPIVEARHHSGMSLDRLGKRLSLSRQYLSRSEQATYSGLNPALVKWAAEQLGVSGGAVIQKYKEFQRLVRNATRENVNPELLARRNSGRPGHEIFLAWREQYWISPIAFSNALCVHPESVKNYEEGFISSMPEQLQKALSQVKLIDPNWTEIRVESRSPEGPVRPHTAPTPL